MTVVRTEAPPRLSASDLDAMAPATIPGRPRVLAYVGRWGRARRWLPAEARRVLDVGCAFGYGTAALTGRGESRRLVIGIEHDATHLAEADRRFPWVPVVRADAADLPIADGSADAAVMLDVLEHVADPAAVLAELHRVLRPGGVLVLSVPHRGLLARLDSLNVYPALRRRFPSWPPLEPAEGTATGTHRHFSPAELRELLGAGFAVDRVGRTALGAAELFHLAILVVFKALLRASHVYRALMGVHLLVYLLDDAIPAGRLGYYVTVRAARR
jgi:SAM-dependent methyltransferase